MNQSSATEFARHSFENHFFSIVDWISSNLKLPHAFLRFPSYPGMSVVINGQRVLDFNFLSRPLCGVASNYNIVPTTTEAACFVPYGRNGPMVSINTEELTSEAIKAGIREEALLEILLLHELVHASMMGHIAQIQANHPWVMSHAFRYIHEAVALKVSEFGFSSFIESATAEDVNKYLTYIQLESKTRADGAFYQPYFLEYQEVDLGDFWHRLRGSQPAPGIFELVENCK